MRQNNDLGWGATILIAILAIGAVWLSSIDDGPDACHWPSGDPRNPTGCVIYQDRTVTVTVTETR